MWRSGGGGEAAELEFGELAPRHVCGVLSFGGNSLRKHCIKTQGHRELYSLFAGSDGQCRVCLRDFGCRIRQKSHFRGGMHKASGCCAAKYVLNNNYPRLLPQAAFDLDALDSTCSTRCKKAGTPLSRVSRCRFLRCGPMRPWRSGPMPQAFFYASDLKG
jgi:hypothetical protein